MNQVVWKNLSEQERLAEWDRVHDFFAGERAKCEEFLNQNITLFDHYNNNEKRISQYNGEEFVNYDGEYGNGLMCKHCGKIMIQKTGSCRILGRLVKLMLNHIEKTHLIKMKSYSTSLSMYRTISLKITSNSMSMRDGIE